MDRNHPSRRSCLLRRSTAALTVALALIATLALAPDADAQRRGYFSSDPSVTVDMSVLGGPSGAPVATRPLPTSEATPPADADTVRSPEGLLFPPPSPPASRLVGHFANAAPQLKPPAASRAPTSAPVSRLNVPAPSTMPKAPEPAPMPKAPEPAPMPKMAAPAPKAPAAMAKAPEPPTVRQPSKPAAPVPPMPAMPKPAATPEPPVAAPQKAETAPATSKPVETASRTPETATPSAASAPDGLVRVLFDSGSAKLPDGARSELQSLVTKLNADDTLRVQLEAYAEGTSDTASQARRLSLSRALAVRSFLIDQGVRSTRMDVRALGNKQSDPPGPADRVDARLVAR